MDGYEACALVETPDRAQRRGKPVVRKLAYHAAGPDSIPGLGGENC